MWFAFCFYIGLVFVLHLTANNEIFTLFAILGPVKSAQMTYNAEGKSKGIATVIFASHGHSAKAISEFQNRTFDGRVREMIKQKPMRIEVILNPEAAAAALHARYLRRLDAF